MKFTIAEETELNSGYKDIFRLMLESMPHWLDWLGTDGHFKFVSPACENISGYQPEQFLADPNLVFSLVHPDDYQLLNEHRRQELEQPTLASELEFRIFHKNGEMRWISHVCKPLLQDGAYIGHFSVNRDITLQKKTQEELNLSNQTLQAMINAPTDVIVLVDRDHKIVQANQTVADRLKLRSDEIVGKRFLDVIPNTPLLAQAREADTQRVFETGMPRRVEDVGVSGIFDNSYFPIFDQQGSVRLVAVIARDITQRKQMEDELRQSNQTIQMLLNAPDDVVVVFDLDGIIQMANETLASLVRHPVSELIGKVLWDYFPIEVTNFRKGVMEKVRQTRKPERVIDRVRSGVYDSVVVPIFDGEMNITRFAILARDISNQIKDQEALAQREAMLSTIVNNAPIVLFVFDKQGTITFAEGQAFATANYSNQEFIGRNIIHFPNRAGIFKEGMHAVLEGKDYTTQITTPGNHNFDIRFTPLRDQFGEITGMICVGIDITEYQRIQAELRRSKEELQVILGGIAETIAVINPQGTLIYINQAGIDLTGCASIEELAEAIKHPDQINLRDDAGKPINWEQLSQLDIFEGNNLGSMIFLLQPKNSTEDRWISTKATPIFDSMGNLQLIIIIAHDLTEIKHNQLQLENAQKELEKKISERTMELNLANQELVLRMEERHRAAAHAETLARVAAQVNLQADLPSTLRTICEAIIGAVHYPYSSIFLYDERQDQFRLATAVPRHDYAPELTNIPRAQYEQYLQVYGPVIVIPDRQLIPEFYNTQMISAYDIRTMISLPLVSNGELIGNLNVASTGEVRLPTPEELHLLVALADQATIAISKARLFEQVLEGSKRLQLLSEQLVEIQEAERRNLARELHDEIGQLLTSLRLNLDLANRALPTEQADVKEAQNQLTRANETTAQLLGRIREISLDLRPTLLDDLGLLPALLVQFERFSTHTDLQVHFKHSGVESRFSAQVETVAYRVVQEALTNVVRHAQTNEAFVRLWADKQFLRLQVEDHGLGFDPQIIQIPNQTSGLSGMQERVSLCSGLFEIESEPGKGTCLTVELPLSPVTSL
jgi:PAS domain S-box-containing protein